MEDVYKTITRPVKEIVFKEKGSKFYGYAFPVNSEEEVKTYLETVKKEHHAARHCCYAYQLGTENITYRANDDGEPNNTAGMPIYGQIQSFEVTNIIIIVVRYFGGVKLGVGGLITAYKTSAQRTLENANIIIKTIRKRFLITFEYKMMNTAMRIIKEKKLKIMDQHLGLDCKITIAVRKKYASDVFQIFSDTFEIAIKEI